MRGGQIGDGLFGLHQQPPSIGERWTAEPGIAEKADRSCFQKNAGVGDELKADGVRFGQGAFIQAVAASKSGNTFVGYGRRATVRYALTIQRLTAVSATKANCRTCG